MTAFREKAEREQSAENNQNAAEANNAMRFQIYQDAARLWRWRLVAGNGEILASGESYKTRAMAVKGVRLVKESFGAKVEFIKETKEEIKDVP
jgi:uncharacterized protein YegP (UPF0339 family)